MVGWLTALLFTLIAVSTLSVKEHATTLTAPTPEGQEQAAKINAVSRDFQVLLDTYAANYYSFRKNGNTANQSVADRSVSQIEDNLEAMRAQIQENQGYIQSFLDEYQNTNPELDRLHQRSQQMQTQGPEIADELVTSTQDLSRPIDITGIMIRVVILMLLLGAAFAIRSSSQ
jgi:chromosome segregation ATPase